MWSYTPRRIAAFLIFARLRTQRERAVSISDNAIAARGADKDYKQRLKDLTREQL